MAGVSCADDMTSWTLSLPVPPSKTCVPVVPTVNTNVSLPVPP